MKTNSVIAFIKANGFTALSRVIKVTNSANKVPYITFTGAPGAEQGTNVYFSKASGASVKLGDAVTKDLLSKLQVVEYTAPDGSARIKFSTGQMSIADLMLDEVEEQSTVLAK